VRGAGGNTARSAMQIPANAFFMRFNIAVPGTCVPGTQTIDGNTALYLRFWIVLGLMPAFFAARRAEISCISLPMLD